MKFRIMNKRNIRIFWILNVMIFVIFLTISCLPFDESMVWTFEDIFYGLVCLIFFVSFPILSYFMGAFTICKIEKQNLIIKKPFFTRVISFNNLQRILLQDFQPLRGNKILYIIIAEKEARLDKFKITDMMIKPPKGILLIHYKKEIMIQIKENYKGEIGFEKVYLDDELDIIPRVGCVRNRW